MATTVVKPELDLVLRFLPEEFEELLTGLSFEKAQAIRDYFEEIRYLFTKIEPDLRRVAVSAEDGISFPYQTLTTDATNLISGTLNGVTATKSVLKTNSSTSTQFNWPECKRQNDALIVTGIGDGVAEHAFLVNPDYNVKAFNVEYDGSGNLVLAYRPGICIPVNGQPTRLMFIAFVEDVTRKGNIKAIPVNIANGTRIYLHQRMPGE